MDARAYRAATAQVARNALEDKFGLRENEIVEASVLLAVFTTVALTACVMRLLAVLIRHRPIGIDDWSMLIAFISMVGLTVSSAECLRRYNGLFTGRTTESDFLKAIFAFEVNGTIAVSAVKISVLILYLRIAGQTRTPFWWSTVAMLGIVGAMTIVVVVMCFAQCTPISHIWNLSGPGSCVEMTEYYYVVAAYLVVSDIVIAAMPIPMLWGLRKPTRERAVLVALFGMMLIPVLASIARLITEIEIGHLTSTKIGTKIGLRSMELSVIELDLGIACACAPSIKALVVPPRPVSQRSSSARSSKVRCFADKPAKRLSIWRSSVVPSGQPSSSRSGEDGTLELITALPTGSHGRAENLTGIPESSAPASLSLSEARSEASLNKTWWSMETAAV